MWEVLNKHGSCCDFEDDEFHKIVSTATNLLYIHQSFICLSSLNYCSTVHHNSITWYNTPIVYFNYLWNHVFSTFLPFSNQFTLEELLIYIHRELFKVTLITANSFFVCVSTIKRSVVNIHLWCAYILCRYSDEKKIILMQLSFHQSIVLRSIRQSHEWSFLSHNRNAFVKLDLCSSATTTI